jgi:hypothetical protein
MAFRHGKNTKILINSSDLSAFFNDASVSSSVETAETTTFGVGGGAKTYVTGLNDGSLSLSGLFDGDTGAVDDVMAGVLSSDNEVTFMVAPDNGIVLGARCYIGKSIDTKYDLSSPVADVVKTSADFQVNGGIGRGIVLAPLSSVSSTSNGTSVDNAASTANGGIGVLHVPVNTRNGTIIVKIQHSSDNSTFADLVTFATVASATKTSECVVVASGITVNRYLRVSYTVAGSSGAATIAAAFARR